MFHEAQISGLFEQTYAIKLIAWVKHVDEPWLVDNVQRACVTVNRSRGQALGHLPHIALPLQTLPDAMSSIFKISRD